MHGECFAVSSVTRNGFFRGIKGTRSEVGVNKHLAEVGWSIEVEGGGNFFKETVGSGIQGEDMEISLGYI